jgi:hypothetical protein
MKQTILYVALGTLLLAGCAGTPSVTAVSADSSVAECDRRMVAEKVDLGSVGGKLRRDNCIEAMKLKPQLEKMSPAVIKTTLGFAECKAEARSRNLPLAQHQEELFACANTHGGQLAQACLTESIMGKVPVDALEMNMANCLQIKQGSAR